MNLTRKEFLKSALGMAGAFVGIGMLGGCSDDSQPAVDKGVVADAQAGCSDQTITQNHGHALAIPKADATAGLEKSYSIRGTAGHDHMVTVSAADFATLATGATVTVTSTSAAGHTHDVTITCA